MPKVSVIVPIYGVERYIERCARSLFEQTLDDIEYLFIDDCTPDHSISILMQVLEDYPCRKSQVIVHRMEQNSGVGKVREWGMRHATGDYIIQCDSDDWADKDMYRLLYEKAVSEEADVVVCDFAKAKANAQHVKKGCQTTDIHVFLEDLIYKNSSWAVWNKLFRRSLCQPDIVYPAGSMGDDMVIVLQLVSRARKIGYVAQPLYFYSINPNSMVRTKTVESCLAAYSQQLRNTDIVLQALSSCCDSKQDTRSYRDFLLYLTSINMTPLAYHDKECLKHWGECCPSLGIGFFLNGKVAFRHKFKYAKLRTHYLFKIGVQN